MPHNIVHSKHTIFNIPLSIFQRSKGGEYLINDKTSSLFNSGEKSRRPRYTSHQFSSLSSFLVSIQNYTIHQRYTELFTFVPEKLSLHPALKNRMRVRKTERKREKGEEREARCSDGSIRIYAFNANHILINADRCFLRREKNTKKRVETRKRMDRGSEVREKKGKRRKECKCVLKSYHTLMGPSREWKQGEFNCRKKETQSVPRLAFRRNSRTERRLSTKGARNSLTLCDVTNSTFVFHKKEFSSLRLTLITLFVPSEIWNKESCDQK